MYKEVSIRQHDIKDCGAACLNAASRALTTIMDFGRTVGTSIRMLVSGKRC